VAVGCAVSNVSYVVGWRDYPQRSYVTNVISAADAQPLRVVDVAVPTDVMLPVGHPYNLPSMMFRPLGERLSAASAGTDLQMLRPDGRPGVLVPEPGGLITRPGPVEGCGYPVRSAPVGMAFDAAPQQWDWWAVIRYLAQHDGTLTVRLGEREVEVPVLSGPHTYVLPGNGPLDRLSVRGTAGNVVCVDSIAVGAIKALEELS
jgi:hypothetical protein